MTTDHRLGLLLGSGAVTPSQIATVARAAEQAGFAELWASEDYFFTGGISTAAIALGATERLSVGIGVVPVFTRHPGLAAMEAATIAGAFPDRFTLGVGTGVERWLRQMGIEQGKPLASVREYVGALRALGAGETYSSDGFFPSDQIALHAPHEFPVHIGAIGPKMLDLAAEISDGAILSVLSSPDYVRWAVQRFHAAAGRDVPIVAFAMYVCDADGALARDRARALLSRYLVRVSPMTDALGISDQVGRRVEQAAAGVEPDPIPDEWVRAMTISGTPADCRAATKELFDAGVTTVTLYLSAESDALSQIAAATSLAQP